MLTAVEALIRLQEGNARFISDVRSVTSMASYMRRGELADGQAPVAIVLGCADSRVPAEIVFDQGLGDLFVIRVAGNIVAPSQVGSVEFAAARFGTRLVVVLGHSHCGAIAATLDDLRSGAPNPSSNLRSIVDRIRPSVEPLYVAGQSLSPAELAAQAMRANVRASTNHLRHGSPLLEKLVNHEGLLVVGAEYALDSGKVEFFDGVPAELRQVSGS